MYKLIAIDMDGTLLREDKTISDKTKNAIRKAKGNGIKVVLASGRPIEGLYQYLEPLDLISEEDYVLSYNGSLVQNTKTKEVIMSHCLKARDGDVLYKLSQEIGVNIHGFSKKYGMITPKISKYSEIEALRNKFDLKVMDFRLVEDEDEYIKFMMIDEPDILTRGISLIPKEFYDKYTILRSEDIFLEFLNKESNKGVGIEALAKYLGLSRDEVICVGDAENDKHMIEYAGLGVAMGNATVGIKEIAKYIAPTNEEDGVAHVIEKFML
ncbi:sugar-phosphatase [Clostridium sp. YIM B02551]|uniref:sugar-phosphatase n=1 Tax=Clostridium sp. YIM B02551 TaxID=2910679 RepID=UPI001EEC5935|nr:sugar-phosphatase [Clostridium sp. YIM B02551]